jgi:hypothetical protein
MVEELREGGRQGGREGGRIEIFGTVAARSTSFKGKGTTEVYSAKEKRQEKQAAGGKGGGGGAKAEGGREEEGEGGREGGREGAGTHHRAVLLIDVDRGGGMNACPPHPVLDWLQGDAAFSPTVLGVVGAYLGEREGGREGIELWESRKGEGPTGRNLTPHSEASLFVFPPPSRASHLLLLLVPADELLQACPDKLEGGHVLEGLAREGEREGGREGGP